jgi:hypothetical protein
MTPALILAATLAMGQPVTDNGGGEPLPPGAPTDSYELAAWCYGALNEYLVIYEKVIPDLKDIDRMFGTPVVEDKPYKSDMAAAHVELKLIGASVTDAEKASPTPIADRGLAALRQGQAIWSVAEGKSERELARAWLLWALPARCDSNAKELTQRSLLLGRALKYNADAPAPTPDQAAASDTIEGILSKSQSDGSPAAADAPPGSDAAPQGPTPPADTPPAAEAPAAAPPAGDAPPADPPPKPRPYPY